MRYVLFVFLLLMIACTPGEPPSTLSFSTDTSRPVLKSGYYLIKDDTGTGSIHRVLQSMERNDPLDGQVFFIDTDDHVSFKHIDSLFIKKRDHNQGQEYELNLWLNGIGRAGLSRLTTQQFQYPSFESPIQMGMVINNTLVQVATVMSSIENGRMAISGPYNRKDLEKIKQEIINSK